MFFIDQFFLHSVDSVHQKAFAPQRIAGAVLTTAILAVALFAMIKVGVSHQISADKLKNLGALSLVAVGGLQGIYNLCVGTSLQNTKDGKWHGFLAHLFSHIPAIGMLTVGSAAEFYESGEGVDLNDPLLNGN